MLLVAALLSPCLTTSLSVPAGIPRPRLVVSRPLMQVPPALVPDEPKRQSPQRWNRPLRSCVHTLAFLTILRGGSAAAAAGPLKDSVQQAADLFFIVKIPATLLAGAAIGQILEKPDESTVDMVNGTRMSKFMRLLYIMLVASTIFLELSAVYITTASHVRLFAGGFDPMATNGVALAVREAELGYVSTRLFFFGGIATFLTSLAIRALLSLPAALGRPAACLLVGNVFGLLAYFNKTVVNYNGAAGMLWRLLQLGIPFLTSSITGCISLALTLSAVVYAASAIKTCVFNDQSA